MFVLTRRSALPRLQFVPGGLARFHDDRVTLIPLSTAQETVITAEPLSGGGYGVILNAGERASVVAQYPALRPARRQVRRLAGDAGLCVRIRPGGEVLPGDPTLLPGFGGRRAATGLHRHPAQGDRSD